MLRQAERPEDWRVRSLDDLRVRGLAHSLKWHSNSGHLEKDDIETNKFEVSYDNTKEELFKAV